ncbi:MAG: hypothetical protein ACLSW4_03955 [Clostridia bacterium]
MEQSANEILIKPEYRPCTYTKNEITKKALFHKWFIEKDVFKNEHYKAFIELENGKMLEVSHKDIRFTDNKIKEYIFEEGE